MEKIIQLACQIPVKGRSAAKSIIFEQTETYLSLFKTVCFFTNPIFIISPFAKFSHDLWYVRSIYYLHYIQIYLLVIRCYVYFKWYWFFKASFLLSLLIIVSKTTSACFFFLKIKHFISNKGLFFISTNYFYQFANSDAVTYFLQILRVLNTLKF